MAKEKGCRILEIRTGSGEVLFSLWLVEKEEPTQEPLQEEKKQPKEQEKTGKAGGGNKGDGKGNPKQAGSNDAMMTDAQKRYLFRILAENGLEGEAAHEELKKAFGVDSLKKVTKLEASREIERRLEKSKGGAIHD